LHAQLLKERQSRPEQTEDRQRDLAGRDFFVSKRFDVGAFEQDLRNVHNAYRRLDEKISQEQALKNGTTPGQTDTGGHIRPAYEVS